MLMNLEEFEMICKSYRLSYNVWEGVDNDKVFTRLDDITDKLIDLIVDTVHSVEGKSYEKEYLKLALKYVKPDDKCWNDRLEELKRA